MGISGFMESVQGGGMEFPDFWIAVQEAQSQSIQNRLIRPGAIAARSKGFPGFSVAVRGAQPKPTENASCRRRTFRPLSKRSGRDRPKMHHAAVRDSMPSDRFIAQHHAAALWDCRRRYSASSKASARPECFFRFRHSMHCGNSCRAFCLASSFSVFSKPNGRFHVCGITLV